MFFFWPRTIENRSALRTACAALFAVLISFYFHLQTPYWSGMTVVIVANLYTGSIIDKAIMRIIGTIAGAFLGFFVAGLVVNSFLLYLLSCFLIIAVAVYYYNLSSYGYAYLLGALCAFIVISQLALNPQNAFFVAIWRPVEIGIGVLVSALCAYAVFPNHLKDNVVEQIEDIFTDFSAEFSQLSTSIKQGGIDFAFLVQSNLQIKKKIRKAVELIGAMNHEIGVTKEQTDEIRAFLDAFYDLSRQLHYLIITSPQEEDLAALHSLAAEPMFAAIQEDLQVLKDGFVKKPTELIALKTPEALAIFDGKINKFENNYVIKSDFIYSFIHILQQISQRFSMIHSLLMGSPVSSKPSYKILTKQDRLRSDLDLIKHSIKAGMSVILALSFWMVSNWPGGLNGIISSLIISIRKNLFEMTHISLHRLIGCFIGGGAALASLLVFEMNLYDFCLVLFFSVWVFSLFMFKFPKYAYIGLQANIALIITLAQEGGPPVLLDPPLERLGGIFIGIIASFIVANMIWRSDVWTILNRYLDKLYQCLTYNLLQILTVSGSELCLHELANLFWVCRGLLESLADERLSVDKRNKLTQLTQRFEALVFTQASLSHILTTIDKEKALSTAKSFQLDLSAYEKKLIQIYEQHSAVDAQTLAQRLQEVLSGITQNPVFLTIEAKDLRNFMAYINALHHLALQIH